MFESLYSQPFFHDLPVEDRKALARYSRIKEYPKKKILFRNGEPAKNLHVVLVGHLKLFVADAAGQETVVRVAERNDVIELINLLDGSPVHMVGAEVLVPATVLEIALQAARPLLMANSSFAGKIMRAVGIEVRNYLAARQMLSLPAVQRVAWLLAHMSRHMGGKGGSFRFPYDKSVAAAELCMSPETFSRALSRLKVIGMTHKDDEIHIEDFARLKEFIVSGDARGKGRGKNAGMDERSSKLRS